MQTVKDAPALILAGAAALAVYAVIVTLALRPATPSTWPNLGYYLLLVLNSYVSLRFTETAFAVRTRLDAAMNTILGAGYAVLPWAAGSAVWFHLGVAAFFAIAVVKYATWLGIVDSPVFLGRKIGANSLAGLVSLAAVAAIMWWGPAGWIPLLALTVFAIGTLWVLVFDPLYRTG